MADENFKQYIIFSGSLQEHILKHIRFLPQLSLTLLEKVLETIRNK